MRALAFPDNFTRHFIGFEPLLRFSESLNETNFPPHNIEKLDENHYRLTLAIAGYKKENIDITVKSGVLSITGNSGDDKQQQFLYQGIAFRDFGRNFKIGENVEVASASLEHGLLIIDLVREEPEEDKPKVIMIK